MNLLVWTNHQRIGILGYDGPSGRFSFIYDDAWCASQARFALSPSLPLVHDAQLTADVHSAAVRQFFQNLLPEGQALDAAANVNKLSKSNLIGLLHALGRETAGALVLTLENAAPSSERMAPRHLPKEELSQRIRQRPHLPFSVWDNKVRLSIAGNQDKLAVYEKAGEWYLAESDNLASTVILKPEPLNTGMTGLTTNEYLCMRLAKVIGLPVPETRLEFIPEPVLAIHRFDRRHDAQDTELVHRIHCIDGCQALGLPVDFKYERPYGDARDVRDIRDGASIPRFFQLLQNQEIVFEPAKSISQFLQWIIYQVLIGNTDAHAKNISFFCENAGLSFAPWYDMVSVLAFSQHNLEDSLAMAIGDNFQPRTIRAFDWAQLAHENKLQPRYVAAELTRLATLCRKNIATVADDVRKQGGNTAMIDKVTHIVTSQSEQALHVAKEITRIKPRLFN